jgi:hypothetical protein
LGFDADAIIEHLENERVPYTAPTRLHTAFEKAREELLVDGTGFRQFNHPLYFITMTDGNSIDVPSLQEELNKPVFQRAGSVDEENPQHKVLSIKFAPPVATDDDDGQPSVRF